MLQYGTSRIFESIAWKINANQIQTTENLKENKTKKIILRAKTGLSPGKSYQI